MSARSRLPRRSVLLAGAALASAGLLAACGTSGSDTSSTPLPGLTKDTIKVGFSVNDLGTLAKSLGFKQPDYGGYDKQIAAINAIIKDVNSSGGMGGRQVQPVFNRYLGSNDAPTYAEAQCKKFTQDDRVTATMIDGGFQNNTIPCFASAKTLLLMQSLLAIDQTQFERNSPYLWSPTNPEYTGFLKAEMKTLNDAGFFTGAKGVLLMPADDEVSRRVTNSVAIPYLKSVGVTNVQASYIDSTNTGTLGASATAALSTGKNAGLDRVVVIGGARIQPVALSDQAAVGYESKWAVATYDNPIFSENNPDSIIPELRNGMVGLGYAPAQDVNQQQTPAFPDPTNPAQKKCYDVVTAAGATPPENLRNNWKMSMLYCDAIYFLDTAFDQLAGKDEVTGAEFKDAAGKIGTTYRSAMAFNSQWGPNVYAGTNSAMKLSWDSAAGAFKYDGTIVTFAAGSADAAAVTSQPAGAAPTSAAPAPSVASTPGSSVAGVPPASTGPVPLETITINP